jgi:hypothetical protein
MFRRLELWPADGILGLGSNYKVWSRALPRFSLTLLADDAEKKSLEIGRVPGRCQPCRLEHLVGKEDQASGNAEMGFSGLLGRLQEIAILGGSVTNLSN